MLTVALKPKTEITVPKSIRRQAAYRAGDPFLRQRKPRFLLSGWRRSGQERKLRVRIS
jgi:hypothetical protein